MKYWSFISYSHRDKMWGDWLHKSLESYRVPRPLVGKTTTRGESVPDRIYPVFRDREELPTAVDLGEIINTALDQSRYLIVICSPNSAKSQWVNQEIINFKRLGRENRVLAIIVAGEPNAAEGKPGFTADDECFPPALKYKIGSDGYLTVERTEPIAADARTHADGKNNALLKLLAGVLGVNYDDLKRRDETARRRRQRIALATVSCIAAVIAVLAVAAFLQRNEAISQRELAIQEKRRADDNASEATRQRNEAVEQRRSAEFNLAQSHLGRARQLLSANDPAPAVEAAWKALEMAKNAGRALEPAWWVLRRALDANRVAMQWQAAPNDISALAFDTSGERVLTFASSANEARIWAVDGGHEIARLALDPFTGYVGFTVDTTEIVSVRTWFKDAKSYEETGTSGVDLAWWNPTTGEKLRSITIPEVAYHGMISNSAAEPEWIVTQDHGNDGTYRLVRLRDGWAEQTLPVSSQSDWAGRPEPIPECGIVLLVDPVDGVKLFPLGEKTGEPGRLAGISATEKLRLSHFVPSADRTAFAALVWSEDLLGAGVWSAVSGERLAWLSNEGGSISSSAWIGAAGPDGLTGHNEELIEPLAAALGRTPHPPVAYDARRLIWQEAKDGAVAVVLGDRGAATLSRPAAAWETELDADVSSIALSPDGRHAATGNERGQVTLWRTEAPFDRESGLPPDLSFHIGTTPVPSDAHGTTFLEAGLNRIVRWDVGGRRVLGEFEGFSRPENTLLGITMSVGAKWLAITPSLPILQPVPEGWETTFHDLETGRMIGRCPARQWQLAHSSRRALASDGVSWRIFAEDETASSSFVPKSSQPYDGEYVTVVAITPDGRQVIEARGDGLLEIFDAENGASIRLHRFVDAGEITSINSISLSPTGRWALLASLNRWWQMDITSGDVREIFKDGDRPDGGLQFLDGGSLLVANVGTMVKWWTFPDLTPVSQSRMEGTSLSVYISTNEQELILRPTWEDVVTIVDRSTGATVRRFTNVKAMSSDATLIAVSVDIGGTEGIRILRLQDGEILAERPGVRTSELAFATDGSRVAFLEEGRLFSFPISFTASDLASRAGKHIDAKSP